MNILKFFIGKSNAMLIGALGAVFLLLGFTTCQNNKLRAENSRLKSNQSALLSQIDTFKTKSGLHAASVEQLTFSESELKKYNSELVAEIKDLNIKLKRVTAVAQTTAVAEYEIESVIKDSIIVIDNSRIDTVKCVDFRNEFLTVKGCESRNLPNAYKITITDRVPIDLIVHRVPKKFLFFRFGCKAVKITAVSKNPHAKIEYLDYIKLK